MRDGLGNTMQTPAMATIQLIGGGDSQSGPSPGVETAVSLVSGSTYTASPYVTLAITATGAKATTTKMCISSTAASADRCAPWGVYVRKRRMKLATTQGGRLVRVFFRSLSGQQLPPADAWFVYDSQAPGMDAGAVGAVAVPGYDFVTISYTQAAVDSSSGVAYYLIAGRVGTIPPARCSTSTTAPLLPGMLKTKVRRASQLTLASGGGASPLDTASFDGLKRSTTYSFRICAVDHAKNVAPGITLSASTPA